MIPLLPTKLSYMHVISLREFRESVLLTSRLGAFKLTPVTEEEKIVGRIRSGLNEVKLIEAGKLPVKSAQSFLDEL